MGKLPPKIENPVPVIEAELIVTATVPLEVTVTDFDTDVPTATLPNDSEVVLRLNAGVAALSCSATLFEELFALADTVADCDVVTDDTLAVNEALDAPEATIMLPGTVTEVELLDRATLWPPDGAAELSETLHVVVPVPVNELLLHDSALTVAATVVPVPLRGTAAVGAVLEIVSCPVTRLAVVGAY